MAGNDLLLCQMVVEVARYPWVLHLEYVTPVSVVAAEEWEQIRKCTHRYYLRVEAVRLARKSYPFRQEAPGPVPALVLVAAVEGSPVPVLFPAVVEVLKETGFPGWVPQALTCSACTLLPYSIFVQRSRGILCTQS